ncbi:aspartyl protease [Ceratobasidium sp. AG-Ba]|nr:aspartyl protease [Ceratobasidium sp. AG-Ba]
MRDLVFSVIALATWACASSITIRKATLPAGVRGATPPSIRLVTGDTIIKNDQEQGYFADVQVGGQNFSLALDTGSSDSWIAPRPEINYNNTFSNARIFNDLYLNLTYGSGSVEGYVAQTDNVGFAGYTVNNQTLLYVTKQDLIFNETEAQDPAFGGIVGTGFDTISQILNAVASATNETWGRTILSNIFLANPTLPNHIAIFLDRLGYLNDTGNGTFDIGTYASGFELVAAQPKHPVFTGYAEGTFQWNLLLSDLKINGQSQKLKTELVSNDETHLVNIPPEGSISVLLDTGSTLGQLPTAAWKALYEGMGGVLVKNQSYTEGALLYAVPCMAEARLELGFNNQSILVHPLDLTNLTVVTLPDGSNLTACISYFENGSWYGNDNDLVLGDAFLRNAYAVYDFGKLTNTLSGVAGDPFIQLLPLTNESKASAEFKEARAKALSFFPPEINVSTINDPVPQALGQPSSGSGSSNGGTVSVDLFKFLPLYAAIFVVFLSAIIQ